MQQQTLSHNPSCSFFGPDSDELTFWAPPRSDREQPYRGPHEAIPSQEMEFTTEWQMVSPSEAVYSS
jgi:hypothetical protein